MNPLRGPIRALVELITAAAGHASAIACDLSDFDEVNALIQTVEDRYGGIDVLANNARCIRRPLQESLERWHDVERMIQLNYCAPPRRRTPRYRRLAGSSTPNGPIAACTRPRCTSRW